MVDPTTSTGTGSENAKNHFSKAVEEAKAGAQALAGELTSECKTRSGDARDKANAFASDAKVKATGYAEDGKAKASQAIVGLSRLIDENAGLIDEKVGAKYGEYVCSASKTLADAGTRLDEKSLDELSEEAREFVRKSPGLAVGMAVATGFVLARLFKGK